MMEQPSTCVIVETKLPHNLEVGTNIKFVDVPQDVDHNGPFTVATVTDAFTFTYILESAPQSSAAGGFIDITSSTG